MNALLATLSDLNKVIPIVNHWLHLLSAVVWIGGLAFLVLAVTPGLKSSVPKEFIKPICDTFYKQYRKVVGILLLVILFTGGINLHYVGELMEMQTGNGLSHNAKYLTVFFIKLTLVLGILTLFLYTVLQKAGLSHRAHGRRRRTRKRRANVVEPIPFQKASLWIGVLIILCAATMKHLHL